MSQPRSRGRLTLRHLAAPALALALVAGLPLAAGTDEVLAKAAGVHVAFLVGAIVASVAVIGAFFVRKPVEGSLAEGAPLPH